MPQEIATKATVTIDTAAIINLIFIVWFLNY
jgi:hypothetical protein